MLKYFTWCFQELRYNNIKQGAANLFTYLTEYIVRYPGARPTNDISLEFEFDQNMHCFKMYLTEHNEIVHTSRQCNCRDVCNILLWSVKYT